MNSTALAAFLLGGLGTYLMRASFFAFMGDGLIPPVVGRALRYVGPAVFAAIFLPRVLGESGFATLGERPTPEIVAAVIAGGVGWKTRHVPLTLAVGMVSLWLLQWAGL